MNLPGAIVDLPTLTEQDENDLVEFGIKYGVDFIAGWVLGMYWAKFKVACVTRFAALLLVLTLWGLDWICRPVLCLWRQLAETSFQSTIGIDHSDFQPDI